MVPSSKGDYRFPSAGKDLHYSAQFGNIGRSAGIICGQVGIAVSVSSWARQLLLPCVWRCECCCLEAAVEWACWLASMLRQLYWLHSMFRWGTGWVLQSILIEQGHKLCSVQGYHCWLDSMIGQGYRLESQLIMVGWGLRLCSLTRWCHWLDSVFRQGCKQCPKLGRTTDWAPQPGSLLVVLRCWTVVGQAFWLGGASRSTLQLGGAGGHVLLLSGVTIQYPCWMRPKAVLHNWAVSLAELPA